MRSAVVIGGTGLIGRLLVNKLAQDGSWAQILVIARNEVSTSHPKIRRVPFDFENWSGLEMQIRSFAGTHSTDFFCCLGTTIAAAGTEQKFRRVDFDYVLNFARLAERCSATKLLVVSALGADENSKVFYNRTKGEMEKAVSSLKLKLAYFLRPSLLLGDRDQFRFVERVMVLLSPLYLWMFTGRLSRYKPIKADSVATAMVNIGAGKVSANSVIENAEIFDLAKINLFIR